LPVLIDLKLCLLSRDTWLRPLILILCACDDVLSTDANWNLSLLYYTGRGMPQSYRESFKYEFVKDLICITCISSVVLNCARLFQNPIRSVCVRARALDRYCLIAAEYDHPDAQCQVGHFYANGHHVDRNWDEAFSWYKSAARLGSVEASWNLVLRVCVSVRVGSAIKHRINFVKTMSTAIVEPRMRVFGFAFVLLRSFIVINQALCYKNATGTQRDMNQHFKYALRCGMLACWGLG
jgi:TPR repeat protein